jgi:GNAT superfamily N-acetyltransferase
VFTIRKATRADVDDTWRVRSRAIQHQCANVYTAAQIDAWTSKAPTPGYANDVDSSFYVTVTESRIIGTGMINLGTGKIDAIFVLPEYMGQGTARDMLQHLEALALNVELEYLHLDATLNAAAFYRKCGFVGDKVSIYHSPTGLTLECVPMHKVLYPACGIPQ